MKVSIVVPAYNEEKMLPRSLNAIRQATRAFTEIGWESKIVVCDNNSTDRTAQIAAENGAEVVFEPINQIARARNRGAAGACGEWLIFVDADSFPTRELFARVADEIKSGKCVGGGCLIALDQMWPVVFVVLGFWNLVSRVRKWAAGSFIFCEAETFRKLGGFSNDLFVTEELEFSKRLNQYARECGKRVKIITDVRMVTSARKMHLYARREHARFLLKALLLPKQVFFKREECHPWYDGRR
jgi:glycosyltransferase involved in cell wall biosynthesis